MAERSRESETEAHQASLAERISPETQALVDYADARKAYVRDALTQGQAPDVPGFATRWQAEHARRRRQREQTPEPQRGQGWGR